MNVNTRMVMFSSQEVDYQTPDHVYQRLDYEFKFNFDPCPLKPTFNGLEVDWGSSTFVNPPYGRDIGKWLKKGIEEWRKGKVVVFLLPARTDTRWFQDLVLPYATEVRFVRGRLRFGGATSPAPFPSIVVVYK